MFITTKKESIFNIEKENNISLDEKIDSIINSNKINEAFEVLFTKLNNNKKLISFNNYIAKISIPIFEDKMFKNSMNSPISGELHKIMSKRKNYILNENLIFKYIDEKNEIKPSYVDKEYDTQLKLDNLITISIIFNIRMKNKNMELKDKEFYFYVKEIIKNINALDNKNIKNIIKKGIDYLSNNNIEKNQSIIENIRWYDKFHGIYNNKKHINTISKN